MKTLEKILFPIDFSQCSERVFPFALRMAQQFDAKLDLLFVARDISYLTDIGVHRDKLTKRVDEIAEAGESRMRAFCDKQFSGFPNHESRVVTGDPAEEILKFVDEQDIDLIVMGTHGRRGLERTLMGSVADYVIKNAAIPVMTINPFRTKVT